MGQHTKCIFVILALCLLNVQLAAASPPPFPHELSYPNIVPPIHQFGQYGSDSGQLNEPAAVAYGPDDTIYIADTFNNRVNVYSDSGNFIRSWGSLGHQTGQFRFPQAIAVSRDNLIFVCDTGNNRIEVFDTKGQYLTSWGEAGNGNGQFNEPIAIAVTENAVAVADRANERVQIFDKNGKFVRSIGKSGQAPGEFDFPTDLAFDSAGNLYVADSYNNRIQKFSADGHLIKLWGGWGSFSGLLANPSGLAIHDERVFVSDLINHRIQVFDLEGNYLYQWGRHPPTGHEGNGRLHYPYRLSVSRNGQSVVVCEPFEYRCQIFGDNSFAQVANVDDKAWWDKAGRFHYGSRAASAKNILSISEPDTHSVLVFDISNVDPLFVTRLGGQGRDLGSFVRPSGMLIDPDAGRILVSDGGNHRLEMFQLIEVKKRRPDGPRFVPNKSQALFAKSVISLGLDSLSAQGFAGISPAGNDGSGHSPVEPGAIRLGPDRNYYIADPHNGRVLVLDRKLNLIRTIGTRGSGDGELLVPSDLSFSKDGQKLYVVDTYNFRVEVFSIDGSYLAQWGKPGPASDQFVHPFGITSGKDGFVYVSDDAANRIQKFSEDGQLVGAWGRWGTEPGQFYKPKGLTQDDHFRIIISDFGNHRAQIFDPEGNFIAMFGIGDGYTPPLALASQNQAKSGVPQRAPLISNGGNYLVSWTPTGGSVALNKTFDMNVRVLSKDTRKPSEGVRLSVSAVMPAHYHGMNVKPVVTSVGPGLWQVSGMLLHMPGFWEINFDLDNGIVVERAQSDVRVGN
jgi:DNA-binding beta-propeller fold protein YncE